MVRESELYLCADLFMSFQGIMCTIQPQCFESRNCILWVGQSCQGELGFLI
jgi:hypothetical protein